MDTRKNYVAPAIAAEDTLEQTSLACNATTTDFTGDNFAPNYECRVDVTKNGAFYESGYCSVVVEIPVALS